VKVSRQTLRRFVLGRQGLWPGRRWRGKAGTAQALRAVEAVQVDPLNVIARNHDLALWSRVLDYRPQHLTELLYQDRAFFEYGGVLFIYPMDELRLWRRHMLGRRRSPRWSAFADTHRGALRAVRSALRRHGAVGNRALAGEAVPDSYRGRKDTSLALYYLWLTGQTMIHHRDRFERVYALFAGTAPAEARTAAPRAAVEAFFARKIVAFRGAVRESEWRSRFNDALQIELDRPQARRKIERWVRRGMLTWLEVEGAKEGLLVLAEDEPRLAELEGGRAPEAWRPLETSTDDEAVFLAPLDIVSARGRAGPLFDFDYVWEVYKPAHARRWGYYTLPILIGDRLVGRLDPWLARETSTLEIRGFWLEAGTIADDRLVAALGGGLVRFAEFLGAHTVDLTAISPARLRSRLRDAVAGHVRVVPVRRTASRSRRS